MCDSIMHQVADALDAIGFEVNGRKEASSLKKVLGYVRAHPRAGGIAATRM